MSRAISAIATLIAAIGLALLWKRRDVLTIMRELETQ